MLNPTTGWCSYSTFGPDLDENELIENENGLKLLLALWRDGAELVPGVLGKDNKLNGEGPLPRRAAAERPGHRTSARRTAIRPVPWPYNADGDHNAGFSRRSTTIVRVEPLPEGTTDIDPLEAGWQYVDESKIVVYGAIDPLPTILTKMDDLLAALDSSSSTSFKKSHLPEPADD